MQIEFVYLLVHIRLCVLQCHVLMSDQHKFLVSTQLSMNLQLEGIELENNFCILLDNQYQLMCL